MNGFYWLAVVVAFALGAGIGSSLGYRMGSSQISVYANTANPPLQDDAIAPVVDRSVEFEESDDKQGLVSLEMLHNQLRGLGKRVAFLEGEASLGKQQSTVAEVAGEPQAVSSSADQLREQLLGAGFDDGEYEVITTARDQLRLKRLQLRDKAIREGWFRTDDWTRQARGLDSDAELRKILGDRRFDDYLIATGRDNRVKIDELMGGSAAEQAGLMAGDLIHRYADERVFSSSELRRLTTGGQVGETTSLTILRDGELVDLTVPRGPLGVLISGVSRSGSDLD